MIRTITFYEIDCDECGRRARSEKSVGGYPHEHHFRAEMMSKGWGQFGPQDRLDRCPTCTKAAGPEGDPL